MLTVFKKGAVAMSEIAEYAHSMPQETQEESKEPRETSAFEDPANVAVETAHPADKPYISPALLVATHRSMQTVVNLYLDRNHAFEAWVSSFPSFMTLKAWVGDQSLAL
jgi:hypothetical protein